MIVGTYLKYALLGSILAGCSAVEAVSGETENKNGLRSDRKLGHKKNNRGITTDGYGMTSVPKDKTDSPTFFPTLSVRSWLYKFIFDVQSIIAHAKLSSAFHFSKAHIETNCREFDTVELLIH